MPLLEHELGNCLPVSGNRGLQLHLWQRGQRCLVSTHSASPESSKGLSPLVGRWETGGKPYPSSEYTCWVPSMVDLTEYHAKHIPGQTGSHWLEQLLSASSVLEIYCCSVAKLCPTHCDPMNCSTPGFPICHHLLKFAQVHVHRISYAIQPSHPLSPSSLRKVLELTRASFWEAIAKHSGILPVSRYLEISPDRSTYTQEIGKCWPANHCFRPIPPFPLHPDKG